MASANTSFQGVVRARKPGIRVLTGQATLGATSVDSQTSSGFTLARTAAGVYTVTFQGSFNALEAFDVKVGIAAGAARGIWICSSDLISTTGVLTIEHVLPATGVATEIGAATLYMSFTVKNSSV